MQCEDCSKFKNACLGCIKCKNFLCEEEPCLTCASEDGECKFEPAEEKERE